MKKKHLSYLFLAIASILLAVGVFSHGRFIPKLHIPRLEKKQKEHSDTLSVCLFYHAADYFVYQGSVIGFQYDMLKQLEKDLMEFEPETSGEQPSEDKER